MAIQALYSAATGMTALQTKLDVIANNLANSETTGFKGGRANFEDLLYHHEKLPGTKDSPASTRPRASPSAWQPSLQHADRFHRKATQRPTAARRGHPRQRFLPGNRSQRDHLLHAGRQFLVNSNGDIVMGSANMGRLLEPAITIPPMPSTW